MTVSTACSTSPGCSEFKKRQKADRVAKERAEKKVRHRGCCNLVQGGNATWLHVQQFLGSVINSSNGNDKQQ